MVNELSMGWVKIGAAFDFPVLARAYLLSSTVTTVDGIYFPWTYTDERYFVKCLKMTRRFRIRHIALHDADCL